MSSLILLGGLTLALTMMLTVIVNAPKWGIDHHLRRPEGSIDPIIKHL